MSELVNVEEVQGEMGIERWREEFDAMLPQMRELAEELGVRVIFNLTLTRKGRTAAAQLLAEKLYED